MKNQTGPWAHLLVTLSLLWPAMYNKYPFFYPDTLDYLWGGVRMITNPFDPGTSYGTRSELFGLSLVPFHLHRYPWPLVILAAAITAWTLLLFCRRLRLRYPLLITTGLALFSTLPWHVCRILPDYLAGLLVLWLYLLFSEKYDSKFEFLTLCALVWYGIVSHASHLALVVALLIAPGLFIFRRHPRGWRAVACTLLVAAASQVTLHLLFYRNPMLFPKGPPFLTARLIGDGTGGRYLAEHPGSFTVSKYTHLLKPGAGDFLWKSDGIWQTVSRESYEDRDRIRDEDRRFAWAVVSSYPIAQFKASMGNFFSQLMLWRIDDFGENSWVREHFTDFFRYQGGAYRASAQSRGTLNLQLFSRVQGIALLLALAWCGFASLKWTEYPRDVRLLVFTLAAGVLCNAAITGMLSEPNSRYESRVIWLIPLLALALALQPNQADPNPAEQSPCDPPAPE